MMKALALVGVSSSPLAVFAGLFTARRGERAPTSALPPSFRGASTPSLITERAVGRSFTPTNHRDEGVGAL